MKENNDTTTTDREVAQPRNTQVRQLLYTQEALTDFIK